MTMKRTPIYLDHAAATPLDERVAEAMQPFYTKQFYNPSATYLSAREVRRALYDMRTRIAYWLGAQSGEVIFTAGGSEANNLAIHGVMRQFPDGNIVVSSIEHASVLAPARRYDCREVSVHPDGRIDLNDLKKKIDSSTVLVSIMYANNEIGTIQPIREAAKIVAEIRAGRDTKTPIYFHSDACQASNYLDLHVARLGVDLLSINGSKIYGPKQTGVLYVRGSLSLEPLIDGGGQERGFRAGTENISGIIGLATALNFVQSDRHQEARRLLKLQHQFLHDLNKAVPEAQVNGSRDYRLPNNLHFTLPDTDNERVLMMLDEAGIQAAAGSACTASEEEPSHVLKAIGLSDEDARSSLRLTMGRQTTASQLDYLVQQLSRLTA